MVQSSHQGSNMEQEKENHAEANAKGWLESILEMVAELDAAEKGEHEMGNSEESIRAHIEESVLSVLVRDGWREPTRSGGPEEYEVLLTTGGPALRLIGKLDGYGQPDDWPRLEYQDWGTPWTEYEPAREHREALQKFASVFYYGDS